MSITIPKRLFWTLDAAALTAAFTTTYVLMPAIQRWALRSAWARDSGVAQRLSLPTAGAIEPLPPAGELLWILMLMIPAVLVATEALNGYRPLPKQSIAQLVGSTVMAAFFGLGLVVLVPFALRDPRWSRVFILTFWLSSVMIVGGYRLFLRWYRLKRIAAGYHARRVAFIGSTSSIEQVVAHLISHVSAAEVEMAGYLRLHPLQKPPRVQFNSFRAMEEFPLIGDATALGDVLVHHPIDEVFVTSTSDDPALLKEIIEACDYFRVTLRIVPEMLLFGSLRDLKLLYHADPLQIPQIVLRPPHLDSEALFVKRLIDVVVSAALLVLLLPVFAVIAVAIKLTTPRLPVFYRWRVVGYQGRPFTGYKFSTMVEDADERKTALESQNEMTGPVFKMKSDPRITRLGRLLRKYSLNELPQLWSVLKGDMSLVGPRPAFPHELQRYELWHKRKLCVKPGVTCLWQIRGRNRINSFDEWVRMDLEYIDNWSLWLDFRILVRTGWVVVAGTGS